MKNKEIEVIENPVVNETQTQAFNLFLTLRSQGDLLEWLTGAMQVQAKLCIFSSQEFAVLVEVLKQNDLGFEHGFRDSLLNLINLEMSGEL